MTLLAFLIIGIVCSAAFVVSVFFGGDGLELDHDHDGLFTLQSLLLFGVGFGAVGTLGLAWGLPTTAASGSAVCTGLVGILASRKVTHFLRSQEGTSNLTPSDLTDCRGLVVHRIKGPSVTGQVTVTDPTGRTHYYMASAPHLIEEGRHIRVLSVNAGVLHVTDAPKEG